MRPPFSMNVGSAFLKCERLNKGDSAYIYGNPFFAALPIIAVIALVGLIISVNQKDAERKAKAERKHREWLEDCRRIAAEADKRREAEEYKQRREQEIREERERQRRREEELLQWKSTRHSDCTAEIILDCLAFYPGLSDTEICEKIGIDWDDIDGDMDRLCCDTKEVTGEVVEGFSDCIKFELNPKMLLGGTEEVEQRKKRFEQRQRQKRGDVRRAFEVKSQLDNIDQMEGHKFEEFCAELLEKLGYTHVRVTRGSGDQGVDVIAVKDGVRYAIQCKRYSSDLGNKPVQEVHSGKAFYDCDEAAVMTNRYFTAGAKALAKATDVLLWDRDELKKMIREAIEQFV